jgi:hypothetical protein
MTMRWRAATGRNEHINQAKSSGGVLAGQKDGVGVSHNSEVGQTLVFIWPREHGLAFGIVLGNRGGFGLHGIFFNHDVIMVESGRGCYGVFTPEAIFLQMGRSKIWDYVDDKLLRFESADFTDERRFS